MLSILGLIVIGIWYVGSLPMISILIPDFLKAWYMIPIGIFLIIYGFRPQIAIATVVTALITIILLMANIISIVI